MSKTRQLMTNKTAFCRVGLRGLLMGAAALSSTGIHAQDSANSAGNGVRRKKIVLPAGKRAEHLQEVPIAVSAFDENSLRQQHIDNVEDLSHAAPNLTISKSQGSANSASVYIRGIGQDNSTILNENGVGIYVEGVYLARPVGALVDLVDVSDVEVLRGPQGTLYGRNN